MTRSFLIDLVNTLAPGLAEASRGGTSTDTKRDFHDVVTVHDGATEKAIREAVFARFPDSVLLGEEDGWHRADGSTHGPVPGDLVWLVDPIDGTSNFASGWDHWCISIALTQDDRFVASVICQPVTGKVWSADETGAYVQYPGSPERKLTLDPQARPADGICAGEYPSTRIIAADPQALSRWGESAKAYRSMRRTGSTALDLAYVAEGLAVASYSEGFHPWDVAAGIHLVEAAGGIYRSFTGTEPAHPLWEGTAYVAGASAECLAPALAALGRS